MIASENGVCVKASSVARDLSKPRLEARLGSFSLEKREKLESKYSYRKEPVRFRIDTSELYARYKNEQRDFVTARSEVFAQVKRKKDFAVQSVQRMGRLRCAMIKLMNGREVNKKLLYAQARSALKSRVEAVRKAYTKERERLSRASRCLTWADWLKQEALKGNDQALALLRSREEAQGLKGNTFSTQGEAADSYSVPEGVTKKGTLLFQAGPCVVRDDGEKLQLSKEVSSEALQEALRFVYKRYGSCLVLNGTEEFKEQMVQAVVDSGLSMTFSNPELERQRADCEKHTKGIKVAKTRLRFYKIFVRSEVESIPISFRAFSLWVVV